MTFGEYLVKERGLPLPKITVDKFNEFQKEGSLAYYIGRRGKPIIVAYYLDYLSI